MSECRASASGAKSADMVLLRGRFWSWAQTLLMFFSTGRLPFVFSFRVTEDSKWILQKYSSFRHHADTWSIYAAVHPATVAVDNQKLDLENQTARRTDAQTWTVGQEK